MFLIRTAFWLSLVILCLPAGEGTQEDASIDAFEAFSAAQSTLADLSGFCERNPSVCETGGNLADSFGRKARHGARLVYEYLDGAVGEPAGPADTASSAAGEEKPRV